MRLTEFLRKRGVVVDDGGNVKAIIGRAKDRPGLISKNGANLDDAALAAWESGYFPENGGERPTVRQLLDKLDADLRGDAQYSITDQQARAEFENASGWNQQVNALGAEYGVDPTGMSRAEFFDRIAEGRSVEDLAAEVKSRSDAAAADFAEAERLMRDANLDTAKFYDTGASRTLADLENEYRQEIASGNALKSEGGAGQPVSAGGSARQVPVSPPPLRRGTVNTGRGLAEDGSLPRPEELSAAQSRIAKPDNYKMLAEQYGVDAETGSFREEADIQQLAIEGRLTEEDAAVLAETQNAYENSNAYSEALKAVVNCLV